MIIVMRGIMIMMRNWMIRMIMLIVVVVVVVVIDV